MRRDDICPYPGPAASEVPGSLKAVLRGSPRWEVGPRGVCSLVDVPPQQDVDAGAGMSGGDGLQRGPQPRTGLDDIPPSRGKTRATA